MNNWSKQYSLNIDSVADSVDSVRRSVWCSVLAPDEIYVLGGTTTTTSTVSDQTFQIEFTGTTSDIAIFGGNIAVQAVKDRMKDNLRIPVRSRSKIAHIRVTPQELKARQTLRDFITEKDWRRYITNGFIMVRGRSGKFYQLFADRSHTVVWEHNEKVKELCVRTDESCPPTDHVITMKALVELDEGQIWNESNIHSVREQYYNDGHGPHRLNLVDLKRGAS